MPKTDAELHRDFRDRRKKKGLFRVEVWVPKSGIEVIRKLAEKLRQAVTAAGES